MNALRPELSILVISRTAENMTRLLRAIAANDIGVEYEVLCSWNGDEAEANRIQRISGQDFRLIELRPYNFARNNNAVARHARGELVLFINDDVIPDRGAIRKALDAISNPAVGMVGINLRYTNGLLQHAGVCFDDTGKPYHRFKHKISWDDARVASDMFVPCVTGAFILMRRAEFAALGFDESFNVCGEDIALNLAYRAKFNREILYVAAATAIHVENATRKKTGETKTPPEDMSRILKYSGQRHNGKPVVDVQHPRVRIVTEKPGWIMHRKGEEIQKHLGADHVRINEDWADADIHYYINYGYFRAKPAKGLTVANFTHYDADHLAEKFIETARVVDHCVAVSRATADILRDFGIPDEKITEIVVGADIHFEPKLTVGVVGRVYPGGRKGDDIVAALLSDPEVTAKVRIVASKEGWGVPVWNLPDQADFYRAIDYMLVPSRIEGGPVPFMEALACGTMSIAPEIGVIPQFPHVSYPVGDVAALKGVLLRLAEQHMAQRQFLYASMRGINWTGWATEHEKLFLRLLWPKRKKALQAVPTIERAKADDRAVPAIAV
jgi:GT2 family glycosyltransferase